MVQKHIVIFSEIVNCHFIGVWSSTHTSHFVENSAWFTLLLCRCVTYCYWKLDAQHSPTPSILFFKEWDIFFKLSSYSRMNREHNTGGDGLGGGLEGGIAFFWHSWEECEKNSCINVCVCVCVGHKVGGSTEATLLTCKIPVLYSWVQVVWHRMSGVSVHVCYSSDY